eukprot:1020391-Prymnesium_polylepis.1
MADDYTFVEDLTAEPRSIDEVIPLLEVDLQKALDSTGFLSDVAAISLEEVAEPSAIAPWHGFEHLSIYRSAAATVALRSLLRCTAPGTRESFGGILSTIARGTATSAGEHRNHCYLVGGQVRDVLRGVLGNDIDFNYSCDAQEVALVCVTHKCGRPHCTLAQSHPF